MKIRLVTPQSSVKRTGNRCTAWQWQEILVSLGHEVSTDEESDCDVLIALHASRSFEAISRFREESPKGKLVVALSGSDIYPQPDGPALRSIKIADRLVALQPRAIRQIPAEFADVTRVILQSAKRIGVASRDESAFDICVVGHLREVKDSLRAAEASRQLPKQSKIRILQVGGVHEDEYQERIKVELAENPRFKWLGELDEQEVADVIASSQAMVISSQFEGGARVVGEAVVHQTPVLSSRIDGVMGLLGEEYPGYFEFGDTYALLQLLERFENDDAFSAVLRQATSEAASQFSPELERAAWKKLMDELAE